MFVVVADVSAPHNVATNQAILQVTIPAIALLVSGTAFGWVFDNFGGFGFFSLCAITIALGAGIVIVFRGRFERTADRMLA